MSVLKELGSVLRELLGDDQRPVVVFSSAWPFFHAMGRANPSAVKDILEVVIDSVGERSLLMPSFSAGYKDGVCDLDSAPSLTGVISEVFRRDYAEVRTLSAFFSFAALGPAAKQVSELMPEDAWGDGSIYHWMEQQNARFILLGTDSTHCSYLHRVEWLLRDIIAYRYVKAFEGTLRRSGKEMLCREQLFVRSLEPEARNDFTVLKETLAASGMVSTDVQGVPLAFYDAEQVLSSVLPVMKNDPLLAVINKNDFRI